MHVATTVDSDLAKRFLEDATASADVRTKFDDKPLSWELLRDLTSLSTADFATIYFLRRLLADARHEQWQRRFVATFKKFRLMSAAESRQDLTTRLRLDRYRFLFIPGFHYKSNVSTGADFAGPRAFLTERGFDSRLIEVREDGTVEENAVLIAAAVRQEALKGKPLILISTSKGGPEAALALGSILSDADVRAVSAWISVGGLLNGSFLADDTEHWPTSWLAKIAFLWEGIDQRAIWSIRTATSRKRMASLRFPPHLVILHYIGAPLSGHLASDVRGRWDTLAEYGPNDGLTLLADELVPEGHAVVEIGLDHYYRDREIGAKALALGALVLEELKTSASPVR